MKYGHKELTHNRATIREGCIGGQGRVLWSQRFTGPTLNRSEDLMVAAARGAAAVQGITLVDPEEMQRAFRVATEWNEAFCRDNSVGGQEERGIVAAALCWDVKALRTVLRWERRL